MTDTTQKRRSRMKQNYTLELTVGGVEDKIALSFRNSLHNANKAFQALRIALHGSIMYKQLDLYVNGESTRYKLNGVKLKGVDLGL